MERRGFLKGLIAAGLSAGALGKAVVPAEAKQAGNKAQTVAEFLKTRGFEADGYVGEFKNKRNQEGDIEEKVIVKERSDSPEVHLLYYCFVVEYQTSFRSKISFKDLQDVIKGFDAFWGESREEVLQTIAAIDPPGLVLLLRQRGWRFDRMCTRFYGPLEGERLWMQGEQMHWTYEHPRFGYVFRQSRRCADGKISGMELDSFLDRSREQAVRRLELALAAYS